MRVVKEGKILYDMSIIFETLTQAKQHNIETEVVTWALKYMKDNPQLSIAEAIIEGYNEWIK
jgi:hypothetical protein